MYLYDEDTDITTVALDGFHGPATVELVGRPEAWNDCYDAIPLAPCEEAALAEALTCHHPDCTCGGRTGAEIIFRNGVIPVAYALLPRQA